MSERTRSRVNTEPRGAVNLRPHKVLVVWMTMLIYAVSGCAFINSGHCCSGHSHPNGEAQEDYDHLPVEPGSEKISLSEFTPAPNDCSLSQRGCCGQGLHGEAERIALHAASSQRSTDPSRLVTGLSPSGEADHGPHDSLHAHSRTSCALSRASARSPALESILTVSLLI
jgi:hypothetical protein